MTGRLAAVIVLLLPASLAGAQERVHQTIVVTAALEPTPFESVARTVEIITPTLVTRLPVHSVTDLIEAASSVDLRSRGPSGIQADFSVRGAGFEQVLVLVDGVRIKDSQTGHHGADIPLALDDIERVEVLRGTGSSLFGADAVGGTINIVTRGAGRGTSGAVSLGGDGFADGSVRAGIERGGLRQSFSVWGNRSSGFMADRDFRTIGASSHTALAGGARLMVAHVAKAFGADGFYGPSPSFEWTGQTLVAVTAPLPAARAWRPTLQVAYRTHSDEFLWSVRQPDGFRSRHRTHAAEGTLRLSRDLRAATRLSVGAAMGADWIRSNSLGNRKIGRAALFAELQHAAGARLLLYPGARLDVSSAFGAAWSPSISAALIASPSLKVRGSVGRAFRAPTFTERFYRDPNHRANERLEPERALGIEGGVDWTPRPDWTTAATLFTRRERNVIDWVRASAAIPWQSANVRTVRVDGFELRTSRAFGDVAGATFRAELTSVVPDGLPGLSKYVLDFSRQAAAASGWLRVGRGLTVASSVEFRHRSTGRHHTLVQARISLPWRRAVLFAEGTNLLDIRYQEVPGVAMPGRWVNAGIRLPVF